MPIALAISWTVAPAAAADTPAKKGDKVETINHSTFVLPSSPAEGRDPFFPESNRPYEAAMASTHVVDEVSLLEFKGFSGPDDDRLAIINNHTFAAGDVGFVLTTQGRLQIRCLEIRTNSVIIEVGGQRHELSFSANK